VVNSYEAASEWVPVSLDMSVDFPTDGNYSLTAEKGNSVSNIARSSYSRRHMPSLREERLTPMNPTDATPVLATSNPAPGPPPPPATDGLINSRFSLASLAISADKRREKQAAVEQSVRWELVRGGGRRQRQGRMDYH
jgi:hypothetical protein